MDYKVKRSFIFKGDIVSVGGILTDISPETGERLESLEVAERAEVIVNGHTAENEPTIDSKPVVDKKPFKSQNKGKQS